MAVTLKIKIKKISDDEAQIVIKSRTPFLRKTTPAERFLSQLIVADIKKLFGDSNETS